MIEKCPWEMRIYMKVMSTGVGRCVAKRPCKLRIGVSYARLPVVATHLPTPSSLAEYMTFMSVSQ